MSVQHMQDQKTMLKKKDRSVKHSFNKPIRTALHSIVYAILFTIMAAILIKGPLSLYKDHDTSLVTDFVPVPYLTNSSRAPTIALCMIEPHYQKRKKYQLSNEASEQDIFDSYVQDSSRWKPSFIKQIIYLEDQVKLEGKRLSDDFIQNHTRTVLVDYTRFGFCFAFDLGAVAEMIPQIENEYLPNFLFVLDSGAQLAVNETDETAFGVFVLDSHEDLGLTGPVADNRAMGSFMIVSQSQLGVVYQVAAEHHVRKTYCQENNGRVSDCLKDYLEQHMGGKCRYPWDAEDRIEQDGLCTSEDLRSRAMILEKFKMQGLDMISNVTGCQLPCDRMTFSPIEITRIRAGLIFPQLEHSGVLNNTTSVMLIGIPWKQSVKQVKEIETYPLSSFVGEVGGYFGLFLGLSFWSLLRFLEDRTCRIFKNVNI